MQLRSIVGRLGDVAALQGLIASGAHFVTIHGPPGVGKTTLARKLAFDAGVGDPTRVVFLELAEATTAASLVATFTRRLGVELEGPGSAERLARALRVAGVSLLVLDNLEQVAADAATLLGPWVDAAADTRFLATSRVRLGLEQEHVYDLAPLSLPERGAEVLRSEAVQLFLDRAKASRPDFAIDDTNAEAIADIVTRLDGLPLAIELAAARIRILGPRQLDRELAHRFQVLSGEGGTPRHRGLRAAIDWSWDLLSPAEQVALAQCAVFRGTFDVSAAGAVVDLSGCPGTPAVLDVLQSLRDKSLLFAAAVAPGGDVRLGAYLAIREYAMERLEALEIRASALRRHAEYFVAEGQRRLRSADVDEAHAWVDQEIENLLAVYDPTVDPPKTAEAVALALEALLVAEPRLALHAPGLLRDRLGVALEAAGDLEVDPALRLRAHVARGHVHRMTGRIDASMADFEAARALLTGLDDPQLEGRVQAGLGLGHQAQLRLKEAVASFERALERFVTTGDERGEATTLGNLGAAHLDQGDPGAATKDSQRAIRLHRRRGDRRNEALSRRTLAAAHLEGGHVEEARAELLRALSLVEALGVPLLRGLVLLDLGVCELVDGRPEHAGVALSEAVALHGRLSDVFWEGHVWWFLAQREILAGRTEEARACFVRAEDLLRRRDDPVLSCLLGMGWRQLDALAEPRRSACPPAEPAAEEVEARALAAHCWEVRIGIRLFERSLRAPEAAEARAGLALLEVGAGAQWFIARGGRRVTLRSRPSLRRILECLVRQHRGQPGRALGVDALFAVGWPGEDITAALRSNRVYVAISTLRRLGLRRDLVRTEGGYMLDPDLAVSGGALGSG